MFFIGALLWQRSDGMVDGRVVAPVFDRFSSGSSIAAAIAVVKASDQGFPKVIFQWIYKIFFVKQGQAPVLWML